MNLVPACHLNDVARGPIVMGSHPGVVQPARSSSSATCKQGI